MRTLNRNKLILYYSNQTNTQEPIYAKDASGNIKQVEVDGVLTNVVTGYGDFLYEIPTQFEGNLALSGNSMVDAVDYGIDTSQYSAVLIMDKDAINLSETSLIWAESEIGYKDANNTIVDPYTADYRVVRVSPSINQDRYLLARVVKNGKSVQI